ncbi:polymeric immunoglobulin receptor-like [Conger conger]|uniref:polymeric immunoglobulin receptor-like n=1 Tax=Conger conger TaxID=82655 RepID=UPI002A5AEABE|nr:polymeric immunoglobulin receptor-like [Conger conger]
MSPQYNVPHCDADGVYTVREVAVQSGRSFTIPCLYHREYENHVKYWRHGPDWDFCEYVVRTDHPIVKGETSITDDPTHHVFTVTMRKLKMKDSGYYWCAVEIQHAPDKGAYLHLSVTAGIPGLWVEQQEVAGVEGGHVSVPCHYNEPSSMKKWCRIEGSCVEVNSGKSGRSEMKDDRSKKVFTVTMRELNMEDTGWYRCAAGELQIPVHLTVTQKTTMTTVTTYADGVYTVSRVVAQRGKYVTIPCVYDREYDYHVKYWCHGSNWNFCKTVVRTDSPKHTGKTSITDDPTHHVFTVNMTMLTTWDSGYYWCAVEIQRAGDKGAYLYLSVTADIPGLWVEQQEVAGVEGGHVSVPCHYNEPSSMKKWYRIKGSCLEENSGKSGRSEMKEDHSKKVFTVMLILCLLTEGVQPHTGAREDRTNELTTADSEDEVTYSTVFTNTQSSSHRISPQQSQVE